MLLLKDKILYGGIAGIVFSLVVLIKFYGLTKLSDLIFLSTFYLAILVSVYFTYGVVIEKKLIRAQIKSIISDTFNTLNIFNFKTNKKIDPPEQNNQNEDGDNKNKQILEKTQKLILIVLVSGFIISLSLWIYIYRKYKYFNIKNYFLNIILKNTILLSFVLAIQLLFTTFVTGKYLPLETAEVWKIIINNLLG